LRRPYLCTGKHIRLQGRDCLLAWISTERKFVTSPAPSRSPGSPRVRSSPSCVSNFRHQLPAICEATWPRRFTRLLLMPLRRMAQCALYLRPAPD
jgi:hypothetical protein